MIQKISFFLVLTISLFKCYGQNPYAYSLIPEELKENANAVVRLSETNISVNSIKDLEVSEKRIVTVLNKKGNRHANAYLYYSNTRTIKGMSVVIYNNLGEKIAVFKKSDFKDNSAVSNGTMYSDNRVKYLDYTPEEYPYTISFTSQYKTSTTAFIKSWFPVGGYNLSIEKSTYAFKTNGVAFRDKLYNSNEFIKINIQKNESSVLAEILNQKAIKYEENTPSFGMFMPSLKIALNQFSLYGKEASISDWKSFGKWQYENLLLGRDELSEDVIAKITKLTSGIINKEDKAKAIYEYVQNNTRYISVQLGIGGLQPEEATKVDEVKFGDCKGLTNYTKALLKSQGIDSYYAEVYSGKEKRNFDKEFTSFQGDHVILCIPDGKEYTWLECTSQTMPFGFLGDFTDDRDVLVMKPEGGEIVHTTAYDKSINTFSTKANIVLDVSGAISTEVNIESKGLQYDNRAYISKLDEEDQKKSYSDRWSYLNGIVIGKVKCSENKNLVSLKERVSLNVSNFVTKAGDKLLVPVNPFNRLSHVPSKYKNRKLPFQISRSFIDKDIYVFEVPNEYRIDVIPENYTIESEFGTYKIIVERMEGNKIKYTREFVLEEGVFHKEKYKLYRSFMKSVYKKDKLRFTLINTI